MRWSKDVERGRAAVNLVMQDVKTELGKNAVVVVVGTPDELREELAVRGRGWMVDSVLGDVVGWVLGSDGSAIGISRLEHLGWDEFVVQVADAIQEGIIEVSEHWGAPFPPCRTHRTHPMEAKVVSDVASWTCPKGSGQPIAIGTLAWD